MKRKNIDIIIYKEKRSLLLGLNWLNSKWTFLIIIRFVLFRVHILYHKFARNLGNDRKLIDKARQNLGSEIRTQ